MKFDKSSYPKCPECGILINNMSLIPASLFFERFGCSMKCPKCKVMFEIESKIELSFSTHKIEKKSIHIQTEGERLGDEAYENGEEISSLRLRLDEANNKLK